MEQLIRKDSVGGMQVDPSQAEVKGLTAEHNGETYYFCGKGCRLGFKEDPERYFAPGCTPSM